MEQNNRIRTVLRYAVRTAIAAAITFFLFYVMLPPLNPNSELFWLFLTLTVGIFAFCLGVFRFDRIGQLLKDLDGTSSMKWKKRKDNRTWDAPDEKKGIRSATVTRTVLVLLVLPVVIIVVGGILSSEVFNAKGYASVITVEESDFEADMPEVNEITNIALMDTASARILGNRKLGALANVVSQYVASEQYTQINYQGKPMKLTNLEYDGFFKWLNNKSEGIPGYIMVDTVGNSAEYYELKEGMIYVPSAYFSQNLDRKLRFEYPRRSSRISALRQTRAARCSISCPAPRRVSDCLARWISTR